MDKNKRIRIRCGQGIGDSIYLQAVVHDLLREGYSNLEVCTNYPEIFAHLNPRKVYDKSNKLVLDQKSGSFDIIPFTRSGCHVIAHYTSRKKIAGTCQFEDCYLTAGWTKQIDPKFEFKIPEKVASHAKQIRSDNPGKLLVVYQSLRPAMGRTDGFGDELVPSEDSMKAVLSSLPAHTVIKIGQGDPDSIHCDLDLVNKTNLNESLGYFCSADIIIGQCSLIIPLAECRKIPLIIVFGNRIRTSEHPFLRSICPEKLLLRHRRNGNLELGLWDDDQNLEHHVKDWESGLIHAHQN